MTKLNLSYFRHIMRRDGSLENTIMLKKRKNKQKAAGKEEDQL